MTNIFIPIKVLPICPYIIQLCQMLHHAAHTTAGKQRYTRLHRGKVAQPCELMVVVEIRLCALMNTNIVIVVEYPDNKISQTLMVINVMDDTTTIYVLCIGMAVKCCNYRRKFRE